eukprot:Opistho-2@86435
MAEAVEAIRGSLQRSNSNFGKGNRFSFTNSNLSSEIKSIQIPVAAPAAEPAPAAPRKTPFIIGVAGGTASGKTTVCELILEQLGERGVDSEKRKVAIVSQDNFYKALTDEQKAMANANNYNFDHPDAFDYPLTEKILADLNEGKPVDIPIYDFKTHSRTTETIRLNSCDVILFEGLLVLYTPEIRDLFHMRLFVDSDADTRLSRRVLRDIAERGRDLDSVLRQYTQFVKPAFEEYVLPTKKYADVIIPRGGDNDVAIDLIVQHIKKILGGHTVRARTDTASSGGDGRGHLRPH